MLPKSRVGRRLRSVTAAFAPRAGSVGAADAAAVPHLTHQGLPMAAASVGELRDSTGAAQDGRELRRRMEEDGYVYIVSTDAQLSTIQRTAMSCCAEYIFSTDGGGRLCPAARAARPPGGGGRSTRGADSAGIARPRRRPKSSVGSGCAPQRRRRRRRPKLHARRHRQQQAYAVGAAWWVADRPV
eukprot:SAG31_NODE_254_length_19052_cov_8.982114_3_plen_185_part_00